MRARMVSVGLVVGLMMTLSGQGSAQSSALAPGGTFFDDDGNTHEAMIEALAATGITRGCSDTVADLFCPDGVVTRGQMAAFLTRALDLPASGSDPFVDDDRSVFESDIASISDAGITKGCATDRFCPESPVSRAQMASFLVRALDLPAARSDPFDDDDGSGYEADIAALAAAGITQGCGRRRYCPDAPVTRDQMASFLGRALGLSPIEPPPRPEASIAFTGDTLIHMPVAAAAQTASGYDFTPMFERVRSTLSGTDLAICHLEVPLSPNSTDLSGYPTFNAPGELAEALAWAGYDGCSTASNHSFDKGVAGVFDTLNVLDRAGLGHAGTARSSSEADTVTIYRLEDVTVAHISATWWMNGLVLPPDRTWLVEEPLDVNRLTSLAEQARANGADFVFVSVHCCTEYQRRPTTFQVDTDRALIASDAIDLVVGHHAHVVQPIEVWDGEFILYGLGNFLSGQRRLPETIDGVVAIAELALRDERWVTRSVSYLPTQVEAGSYRIVPATGASWSRTRSAMEAWGAPNVEPMTPR